MKYDLQPLMDQIQEAIYFVDRERKITFWNRAAEALTGYSALEVLGRRCSDNILVHVDKQGKNLCKTGCPLAASMKDGRRRQMEVYLRHKQGYRVPVRVRAVALRSVTGDTVGCAELFDDISAKTAVDERLAVLEKMALTDELTRLSNRKHMDFELNAVFHEKIRQNIQFGVFFVDIDRFKQVNDIHGHHVGDLVLKAVAATLRAAARPYDVIGRWGGEEFLCIIRNVDRSRLAKVAERFRVLVEKTIVPIEEGELSATVSIGAAFAHAYDTPETLIERADRLMYQSKGAGRNRVTSDS